MQMKSKKPPIDVAEFARILRKPWRLQTREERLYVAAHNPRQFSLFEKVHRNLECGLSLFEVTQRNVAKTVREVRTARRMRSGVSECLQCGAQLCTGANFCDSRCRHAFDLEHWGDGRPQEQPVTETLRVSAAVAGTGVSLKAVRDMVLQRGVKINYVRRRT